MEIHCKGSLRVFLSKGVAGAEFGYLIMGGRGAYTIIPTEQTLGIKRIVIAVAG